MKTLTFAETLHPEAAEAHIDPQNGGDSAWGTVYMEAVGDMPVVVAVAERVEIDEEEMPAPISQVATVSRPELANERANAERARPIGRGCFCIEGLVGCIMMVSCVVFTFSIELGAVIIYLVASAFHYVTIIGEMPILFKAIFLLVVQILMIVDAVLLTLSVTITEILGGLTVILTGIFGGCQSGEKWHIYIRKMCHLTRWAFRGFHENWPLERVFPVQAGRTDESEKTEERQSGPPAQPVLVDHEMGLPPQAEQLHVTDEVIVVDDKYTHIEGSFTEEKKIPATK
jgi:hypothetical protein